MRSIILMLMVLLTMSPVAAEQVMPRLISVTGSAEKMIEPNEVYFNIKVNAWSKDLSEAKLQADKIVQNAFSIFKKHSVKEEHTQTTRLNIQPRYMNRHGEREFRDYLVSQTINVLLKDVAAFDALLNELLAQGIHDVDGIHFSHDKIEEMSDELKIEALKNAHVKAQTMAAALNQQVGRPYSIAESGAGYKPMSVRASKFVAEAVASSPTIAKGELKIHSRVNVSFELEN